VGDTIDVKGPVGHYVYDGRGQYTNNRKPGHVKRISLIAGGTGGGLAWLLYHCWLALARCCGCCRLPLLH
jgi:hypothetical protein